jgi:hypothetical protein
MTSIVTTKNGQELARSLKVLVPLIKDDLRQADEAANQAGMPYYISAGKKLIEAKSQLRAMSWGDWLTRNFHLSQMTAQRYMRAARQNNASVVFETLSEATGDRRPPGHRPDWAQPVHEVLKQVKTESFNIRRHLLSESKERELERKLGLQLIDIGFKALSVQLHPDKGGSHDAMQRLNRVRSRLKGAA